jgi:protein-disulfide isomerase
MRKDIYRLAGIAAVLVIALVVGASYFTRAKEVERAEQVKATAEADTSVFVRPHSKIWGPKDAKVTVVEFLDPECESCRAMYPLVKHLLDQYGGRVRLVIRYMPFHQNSVYAISALEAAAEQGRYWEMLEILFAEQPRWGDHHHPKPEIIPELAKKIGLDMAAFERSVNNPAHRNIAQADRADGQKLGVNGTPTFFVNGRMLERLGYEELKAMIDQELAK